LELIYGAKIRHIRDKENLDKEISSDGKGASTDSLQLSRHTSTKWPTEASYIPDTGVPAPHLGFAQVKGSQSFLIS
jgi:hypothetical protein